MKKSILIIISLLISAHIFGQYDVWMMDGRVYRTDDTVKIDSNGLEVLNKKNRLLIVDTSDVFALIGQNDTIYFYQSNDYSLESATMFMKGQIDGLKYKNRLFDAGAFLIGFSAQVLLIYTPVSTFYSPFVSGIFVGTVTAIPPNFDKKIQDPALRNDPDYIKGYKYSVARKKVKNLTFFSLIGLTTGVATAILIENK